MNAILIRSPVWEVDEACVWAAYAKHLPLHCTFTAVYRSSCAGRAVQNAWAVRSELVEYIVESEWPVCVCVCVSLHVCASVAARTVYDADEVADADTGTYAGNAVYQVCVHGNACAFALVRCLTGP